MGAAVDLDMAERLVEVEVPCDQGDGKMRAYVPCESNPQCSWSFPRGVRTRWENGELMDTDDKLVIACGSTSNDHGVEGLEHCFQLKTVPDAQGIRRKIMCRLNPSPQM